MCICIIYLILIAPCQTPVNTLSGIPQEQLNRVARIYIPAKNTMQSGNWNTREWRLDFETQERWENPLMGWTSRYIVFPIQTSNHQNSEVSISFVSMCRSLTLGAHAQRGLQYLSCVCVHVCVCVCVSTLILPLSSMLHQKRILVALRTKLNRYLKMLRSRDKVLFAYHDSVYGLTSCL